MLRHLQHAAWQGTFLREEGIKELADQSHARGECSEKHKLDFQAGSNKREAEIQTLMIPEQDLRKLARCHSAKLPQQLYAQRACRGKGATAGHASTFCPGKSEIAAT